MKIKRFVAILIALMIFSSTVLYDANRVQASVGEAFLSTIPGIVQIVQGIEGSQTYTDWYTNYFSPNYKNGLSQMFTAVGMPSQFGDMAGSTFAGDPIQNLKMWMASKTGTSASSITDDQVKQAAYDMFDHCVIDNSNDSFTMSGDLNSFTKYMINEYKNEYGFEYVYSLNTTNNVNGFSDGDLYNALRRLLNEVQSGKLCTFVLNYYDNPYSYYVAVLTS